uniref:Uncharacterized protein n=1 Tax=Scleropages formosus TaxID=113540 RepID=A0A8C9TL28_SCLFO
MSCVLAPYRLPEMDPQPSSPGQLDSTAPLTLPSVQVSAGNHCSSTSVMSRLCTPSQVGPTVHSGAAPDGKGVASSRAPSVSVSRAQGAGLPALGPSRWLLPADCPSSGRSRPVGTGVGLALIGAASGCRALCRSLLEESCCHLLYVVEDHRWDVNGYFGQERLAHTRLLHTVDMDVALSDPR